MKRPLPAAALCLLCLPAAGQAATPADPADELAELRAEVAAMRAELAALKSGDAGWTDAAREAEVREAVDAAIVGTQAETGTGPGGTQGDGGPRGGYDGNKFFLEGPGHRLDLAGLLQFRHVALQDDADGAEDPTGFEVRRARLAFSGHVIDPKLTFFLQLDAGRDGGDLFVLDAVAQYEFDNGVQVMAGRMVLPFLYEQLLSIKRQLAVDRSITSGFFNLNRSEMVRVDAPLGDRFQVLGAFSDGGNRDRTGALNDATDWAFTSRLEARLLGDAKEGATSTAIDTPTTLLLGAAGHAQRNNDEAGGGADTLTAWTADAVFKTGRLATTFVYVGASADGFDAYGLGAQAGVSVTDQLQPFLRYDFLDDGEVDAVQAVTAGINWYLSGNAAKFTIDGVYVFEAPAGFGDTAPDGLANAAFSSGLGLASPGGGDQLAIRTQFQLLF